MIRKNLLKFFPLFLTILFLVFLAGIVISAVILLFSGQFLAFLGTLLFGALYLVLLFGMIYIQLDMRDALLDMQRIMKEKD